MDGYDAVFADTNGWLLRMAWLLTLDRSEAEDITQEAFARLWERWPEFDSGAANAEGWLRKVVTNLAVDRLRKRGVAERISLLRETRAPSSEEVAGSHVDLHRALRHLSPRQRQCVVLFYWDGLSVADCADVLGVSMGSVSQHLNRAKKHLEASTHLSVWEKS